MTTATSFSAHGSVATTHGVRVEVEPEYNADQSDPGQARCVFVYRVRITNTNREGEGGALQLITRHWRIVDGHGREEIVDGDGVVGRRPALAGGEAFEYSSWCPLRTRWGTMEGWYGFRREDGEEFRVRVGRFFLVAPVEQRP